MDTATLCLLIGVLQMLYTQAVLGNGCLKSQGSCCILCNSGYFLPQECGTCRPCPVTGYNDRPNNKPYCEHCRRCEGIFRYKEKCTSTSNGVCTCIPGKKCTDDKCTQCISDRCPAGQQLVGQKCQNCPQGTFNTGTEHGCKLWKNCSDFGGVHIVNGSHISDVVCGVQNTKVTQAPDRSSAVTSITTEIRQVMRPPPEESSLQIVYIVVCCAVGLFFIAVGVACRHKLTEKIKRICQEIPKPIVKQTQEEDGCSCHYPEEENGGENEPMTLEA